ncbi:MAG: hypothetical protein ACM31C_01995 [Acidobacteriota bacterium]
MRFALLALLVACSHASPDPVPAPAPAPAPARAAPRSLQPAQDLGPVASRLAYEAAHRPATAVSAERVFDALERAGISLADRTQYAGVAMKAAYCAGGRSADGLVVAICEYPSHEAALAGKAFMDREFPLATAEREVRGSTVMTAVGASRARALSAFQTL